MCTRGGGRWANFRVELRESDGVPPGLLRIGVLQCYPRWTEPLEALVARCINQALQSHPERQYFPFRLITVRTTFHDAVVSEVAVTHAEGRLFVGAFEIESPSSSPLPGPWGCATLRLAYEVWGTSEIPPVPTLEPVPIHRYDSVKYCRVSELPLAAQACFRRWSFGRVVPKVPGVDDAVLASDVSAFLR